MWDLFLFVVLEKMGSETCKDFFLDLCAHQTGVWLCRHVYVCPNWWCRRPSFFYALVNFWLCWHLSMRIYGVATGLIGVLKSILHNSPSPLHKRICCDRSSLFLIFPRIRRILGSIQPFYKSNKNAFQNRNCSKYSMNICGKYLFSSWK